MNKTKNLRFNTEWTEVYIFCYVITMATMFVMFCIRALKLWYGW